MQNAEKIAMYKEKALKEDAVQAEKARERKAHTSERVNTSSLVIEIISMILIALAIVLCLMVFKELKSYKKQLAYTQEQYKQAMETVNEDREAIADLQKTLEDLGFISVDNEDGTDTDKESSSD